MKKRILTATLEVPFVSSFDDYHDIFELQSNLKDLFGNKLKVKEVASDGTYWGLVYYHGEKPTTQEAKDLLKLEGFDFKDGDIYI